MNLIERAAEKLQTKQAEHSKGEEELRDVGEIAKDLTHEEETKHPSIFDQIGERLLIDPRTQQSPATPSLETVELSLDRASEIGLYPPTAIRSLVESEHRRVKRPLLARLTGRGATQVEFGERILVTSALENEGKTFTAFNLALSLAQERDWEVVLVDGDTVRQSLTRFMKMEERKGLLDVLASPTIALKDVLFQTSIPHLLFIPSGQRVSNAPELLSGNRMGEVLDLLTQHSNRILVFDAPPLLGAPEPSALAEFVGQILFVVKAASTQRQAVADALQLLDKSKAINFVLNQVRHTSGPGYNDYPYTLYTDSA